MKHLVHVMKAAGLVAGMVAFSGVGWAQCKIAVVDMQNAVLESNEGKVQSAKFEGRVTEWQGKLKKIQDEIDAAQKKLQTQSGIASQAVIADLNKTIRDKGSELTRTQEDATKDVDDYRDSLLNPIMKTADEITQALSAEKGYGIVLDSSAQNSSIVYTSKDCEITTEVKTRMNAKSGVAAPAATAAKPAANPAQPARPAASPAQPPKPATSPAQPPK
jgi:outer membrane protein